MKETVTTGHLEITLGVPNFYRQEEGWESCWVPKEGICLPIFSDVSKGIIRKEGSPKVRRLEPWGMMGVSSRVQEHTHSRNIPHAPDFSRLSNRISN